MSENLVSNFFFRRMDGMLALRKSLDAYTLRQKTIASNVANAETPDFVASRVEFEEDLARILDRSSSGVSRTNENHIPIRGGLRRLERLQAEVVDAEYDSMINGVNNVDIDREMAILATNQIHFAAASKVMGQRYSMLQMALRGTR